jgi:hypothetical protein
LSGAPATAHNDSLMSELRVPTHATAAEVRCDDGRVLVGRVFIPVSSSHHSGPMRPEEWLNEAGPFFAFLADDASQAVLLNKNQVAILTVSPVADDPEAPMEAEILSRRVAVDVADRRVQGALAIDMPENQRRVLDYLNRPELFLTVHGDGRWYLIRKSLISRVVEIQEP